MGSLLSVHDPLDTTGSGTLLSEIKGNWAWDYEMP